MPPSPDRGTLAGWVAALTFEPDRAADACTRLNEWLGVLEDRLGDPNVHEGGELGIRREINDVGRCVRDGGGVEAAAALASVAEPSVHQPAMLLLSSLASDVLDLPGHPATRATLKEANILATILPHLGPAAAPDSRARALALLMSTSCAGDPSMVDRLQKAEVPARLEELEADSTVEHLARRCLIGYAEAVTLRTMQTFARTPAGAAFISRPVACTLNFVLRLRARRAKAILLRKDIWAATKIQGIIRSKNAKRKAKRLRQRSACRRRTRECHLVYIWRPPWSLPARRHARHHI